MSEIICGDCCHVMSDMPDNHIDSIITDPPYGLNLLGNAWDNLARQQRADEMDEENKRPFIAHSVEYAGGQAAQAFHRTWATEALRVAKPGCIALVFGSPKTGHRLACGLEDAGWEIRDTIMWCYASGFPKSHNFCGRGTALKPCYEPIVVAQKPIQKTYKHNLATYGVAGLDIDACRISYDSENDRTDNLYRPAADRETQDSGDMPSRRQWGEWFGGKGRWPANVILHEGTVCAEPMQRILYRVKPDKEERCGSEHPTVKPLDLMRYLCRLTKTPTGGIVLDPFAGSGATLEAAVIEGREFIGIELEPDFCADCVRRVERGENTRDNEPEPQPGVQQLDAFTEAV